MVPAALGLRSQGAGKGAVVAFLVATPESGVDSVAVSWALLDPLMALLRPLAALFSAVAAGVLVNALDHPEPPGPAPSPLGPAAEPG